MTRRLVTLSVAITALLATATAGARPVPMHAATRLTLPAVLPMRTLNVPILIYHRIDWPAAGDPAITRALTVSPSDFASQMGWLKRHGYHGIGMRQLYAALMTGARLPRRPVIVTFDDGYSDITQAARVLHGLGWPGVAYIITDRPSGVPRFLRWRDLPGLERLGIEIGSHTISHLSLPSLSDAAALGQLVRSRHALERHLGHPVQWFCYPFGAWTPHDGALLRQAGYVLAVTEEPGPIQHADRPFALHRERVSNTTGRTLAGVVPG